jgi:hypothetical protein
MQSIIGWIAFAIMATVLGQRVSEGILKNTENTLAFIANSLIFGYILWSLIG